MNLSGWFLVPWRYNIRVKLAGFLGKQAHWINHDTSLTRISKTCSQFQFLELLLTHTVTPQNCVLKC